MRISRRALLRAATVALVAAPALAACTGDPDEHAGPDPLAELAAQARSDAALAEGLAATLPTAGEVAKARAEHARVLQAEVDREHPPVSSSAPPPPPPAASGGTKEDLVKALTAAQEKAAGLVPSLPRYRAGMVGSVVAACASLREVVA